MDKTTCTIAGCTKKRTGRKGYCSMHYTRWKRHGDPEWQSRGICEDCGTVWDHKGPGRPASKCAACKAVRTTCLTCGKPAPRTLRSDGTYTKASPYCSQGCRPRCAVEGCDGPVRKGEWCASHYSQHQRTGEVKPFTYKWATDYVCVVCGADVEPGQGRRKHCSNNCQAADWRHKGERPTHAKCRLCGKDFSLGRRNGRFQRTDTMWCHDCGRESPEALRFKRYGVTPEQYDAALERGCPICLRKVDGLDVDHDHTCCPARKHRLCGNCTRGLICGSCNRALGLLRDDPEAIARARTYLLSG